MQIGSAYSGMDAVQMVSRSVELLNEVNRAAVEQSADLDRKLLATAVEAKVTSPSPETAEHLVDQLA